MSERDFLPSNRRRLIVAAETRTKARAQVRDLFPLLWSELELIAVEHIQALDPDDPLITDWQPAVGRQNQYHPASPEGPHWLAVIRTRRRRPAWWEIESRNRDYAAEE